MNRVRLSLYLIADRPSVPLTGCQFIARILEAVRGGVTCVQFRDHKSDPADAQKLAGRLKHCLGPNTPLMLNTSKLLQVALAVDAVGVYLEKPFSPFEAKRILGEKCIVGIPVKTVEDVPLLEKYADYLSVKVGLSLHTNPSDRNVLGMEGLIKVCALSKRPIVAVGGITLKNMEAIRRVLRSNDGIAMAGTLLRGENYD